MGTDAFSRTLEHLPYFLGQLSLGAASTLAVTLGSFALSMVIGFAVTAMRRSQLAFLRAVALTYLETFRNVPLLTQLFVLYFGLAEVGIRLPAFTAALIGFGLNGAAPLSEIFRASLDAIDRGQNEAAMAIGMTHWTRMFHIVLPQAARIALPSVGNYAIGLLKDSSLASAVAVPELVFVARGLISETFLTTSLFILVAVIYFILSFVLSRLFSWGERRLSRGIATI